MNNKEEVLILSVGGSEEPLIYSIKEFKPDKVVLIHSPKTLPICEIVLKETQYNRDNVEFYEIKNAEELDDSFSVSKKAFSKYDDIEKYDVRVDFTGGTKPMVSGIVLAVIEGNYENFKLNYVGEKNSVSRTKNGVGVVKDGGELNKLQINPYKRYAITEFKRGRLFFNNYQFDAAFENFKEAESKAEDKNLIKLAEIYKRIVKFYDVWDKFNNEYDNLSLNLYLKGLLNDILKDQYLSKHFKEEHPDFYKQMIRNDKFLNLKISQNDITITKDINYYLPDLINNAKRRIDEGKFDDAVARLYRCIELIAQLSINKYDCLDIKKLKEDRSIYVNKSSIKKIASPKQLSKINRSHFSGWDKEKVNSIKLDSSKTYKLLDILSSPDQTKIDKKSQKIVLNQKQKIKRKMEIRNSSILAHGLKPIDYNLANDLYNLVLEHANILFKLDKHIEFSKFPKF